MCVSDEWIINARSVIKTCAVYKRTVGGAVETEEDTISLEIVLNAFFF